MNAYKLASFALFSLFLTACGSNPQSYLKGKSEPIVNIEAEIASTLGVEAKSDRLSLENRTEFPLKVAYKLFWYDHNGVTQVNSLFEEQWQNVGLFPKETRVLPLNKPTAESANYRVYLKGR